MADPHHIDANPDPELKINYEDADSSKFLLESSLYKIQLWYTKGDHDCREEIKIHYVALKNYVKNICV